MKHSFRILSVCLFVFFLRHNYLRQRGGVRGCVCMGQVGAYGGEIVMQIERHKAKICQAKLNNQSGRQSSATTTRRRQRQRQQQPAAPNPLMGASEETGAGRRRAEHRARKCHRQPANGNSYGKQPPLDKYY